MSLDEFLTDYWQKKPLLIKQAFPDFQSPLTPSELADIACDPDINARIIKEKPSWNVENSPFSEETFLNLPDYNYSLLVMDLEKHFDYFAELAQLFRFIPDWRFDDIMMSYAPKGGSVGAHVDFYDVFLLQAYGERNWQIESNFSTNTKFIDDIPLKILQDFNPDTEMVLSPGDMLYLPPNIAHHGVALNDCMTISIGFRSLSQIELITNVVDILASDENESYVSDVCLKNMSHPGEISDLAIVNFRKVMQEALELSDKKIKTIIGNQLTEPSNYLEEFFEIHEPEPISSILDNFSANKKLVKNLSAKFCYSVLTDHILLHANGLTIQCSLHRLSFVQYLTDNLVYCSNDFVDYQSEDILNIFQELLANSCVFWEDS